MDARPIGERVEALDDDDEVSLILYLGCSQAARPQDRCSPSPAAKNLFLRRNVRPCYRSLLAGHRSLLVADHRLLLGQTSPEQQQQQRSVLKTYQRRRRTTQLVLHDKAQGPMSPQLLVRCRNSVRPPTYGFVYRKAWVIELPILEETRARQLLLRMGLESFARRAVPDLAKDLCDEFLSTFDAKVGRGTVRNKVVTVDAAAVSRATGLPLGDDGRDAEIVLGTLSKSQELALRKVVKSANGKRTRGYLIKNLDFGDYVQEMQAIATMLMAKLECKQDHFHLLSPEMLLALDTSYRIDVKMRWSELLARMIARSAAAIARSKGTVAFAYGEWLSKIIKNELGEKDLQLAILDEHPVNSVSTDKMVSEEQVATSDAGRTVTVQDVEVIPTYEVTNENQEVSAEDLQQQQRLPLEESGCGEKRDAGVQTEARNEELVTTLRESAEEAQEQEQQEKHLLEKRDAAVQTDESLVTGTAEEQEQQEIGKKRLLSEGSRSAEKQDAGVQTVATDEDSVTALRSENRQLKRRYEEMVCKETRALSIICSLKEAYITLKEELAGTKAKRLRA